MCIDRPAIEIELSPRLILENWVAQFLNNWEYADMLADRAAQIIINEIFNLYPHLGEAANRNWPYQLPNPGSFFPDGQDQKENKDIVL